jgi:hypothetical protein
MFELRNLILLAVFQTSLLIARIPCAVGSGTIPKREFYGNAEAFLKWDQQKREQIAEQFLKLTLLSTEFDVVSCGVRHIDSILMINLDHRPEKFDQSREALSPFGVALSRVPAVFGKEIPAHLIGQLGVHWHDGMLSFLGTSYDLEGKKAHHLMEAADHTWYSHCLSKAAISIVLSQLSAIYRAYFAGMKRAWIMEDDILVLQNPHLVADRIDELEELVGADGWDVLYTDADTRSKRNETVTCAGYVNRPDFHCHNEVWDRKKISDNLFQYGSRYGAYSYVLSRSGMAKILAFYSVLPIFAPYDMDLHIVPGIREFGVFEPIVSHRPDAISDNK